MHTAAVSRGLLRSSLGITTCTQQPNTRQSPRRTARCAANSPKGFGKPAAKPAPAPKQQSPLTASSDKPDIAQDAKPREGEAEELVPEVVTNRMLKRLGFTVGVPLALGLAFFPLFYYLKAVQKVDLPEWLPLITSVLLFGAAGLGISYGVISTSWDPEREGTLLGWKEARANWPVFLQTVKGDNK